LRLAFWSMNIGLGLMIVLSLLPIGLSQAWASMTQGLWYARSADFLQLPALEWLRWLRIVGDTVFIAGVAALAWFVVGLKTGWSYVSGTTPAPARTQTNRAGMAVPGW
jgi:nitric oxide reductase subunit B